MKNVFTQVDQLANLRAVIDRNGLHNYTMFQMFATTIEEGKIDGSIRADLDAKKGAYFVVSVSVGFLHMLSEAGKAFEEHYSLDQEEFIFFGLNLSCDAIKGH